MGIDKKIAIVGKGSKPSLCKEEYLVDIKDTTKERIKELGNSCIEDISKESMSNVKSSGRKSFQGILETCKKLNIDAY